jgi:hypothetical protein
MNETTPRRARPTQLQFDTSATPSRRAAGLPIRILNSGSREGSPIERSFGLSDRRGREMGARVSLFTVVIEEARWSGHFDVGLELGTKVFAFRPQATRTWLPYGPVQSMRYFATAEDRDRAVELYFEQARKRALRATRPEHSAGESR